MSTPLKPLADRVVAVKEKPQMKTASGLYLPESAKEKSAAAKVVAIGSDVKDVKIGDQIVYKEYSANDVKVAGNEYLIIKEEDILATLA
jgi:chaperonin GroES